MFIQFNQHVSNLDEQNYWQNQLENRCTRDVLLVWVLSTENWRRCEESTRTTGKDESLQSIVLRYYLGRLVLEISHLLQTNINFIENQTHLNNNVCKWKQNHKITNQIAGGSTSDLTMAIAKHMQTQVIFGTFSRLVGYSFFVLILLSSYNYFEFILLFEIIFQNNVEK